MVVILKVFNNNGLQADPCRVGGAAGRRRNGGATVTVSVPQPTKNDLDFARFFSQSFLALYLLSLL